MKTHKFARKAFYVDAVRVSESNMEEVAQWCEGKIVEHETDGTFIQVEVYRPFNPRQTQAFVGDWVLYSGNGYKVYPPKAFDKSFEKVKTLTKEQADAAGIKVPHEPRQQPKKAVKKPMKKPVPTEPGNPVLSKEIAGKIEAGAGRTETQVPKPAEKDEAEKFIEDILNEK